MDKDYQFRFVGDYAVTAAGSDGWIRANQAMCESMDKQGCETRTLTVDTRVVEEQKQITYDLLRLDPQKHPIYVVVKRNYGAGNDQTYWYEEHTCPMNWIPNIVGICIENNDDPHGLFTLVRSVPGDGIEVIGEGEVGFDVLPEDQTIFQMFPEVKDPKVKDEEAL